MEVSASIGDTMNVYLEPGREEEEESKYDKTGINSSIHQVPLRNSANQGNKSHPKFHSRDNDSIIKTVSSKMNVGITKQSVALLNETLPFRPASSLGGNYLDQHPGMSIVLILLLGVSLALVTLQMPMITETEVLINYLSRSVIYAIALGLGLRWYDVTIMKSVAVRFNFLYPMTCYVAYQAAACYGFYVLRPNMIIPFIFGRIPAAICGVLCVSMVMMLDAAVFASSTVKSFTLACVVVIDVYLAVDTHLRVMINPIYLTALRI
jgi:hypothetical protein